MSTPARVTAAVADAMRKAAAEHPPSASCRRHEHSKGPPWCQDCHGVHDVAREEEEE